MHSVYLDPATFPSAWGVSFPVFESGWLVSDGARAQSDFCYCVFCYGSGDLNAHKVVSCYMFYCFYRDFLYLHVHYGYDVACLHLLVGGGVGGDELDVGLMIS